jgi:K+-transporting ATPase A subunit
MGFDPSVLTPVHVAISLAAIGAGFVVLYGLVTARRMSGWTAFFLATTAATSLSGFLFPFERFLPSHAFGILSMLILPATLFARYGCRLAGRWRAGYVVTALVLLYLNVFVLVAQGFQKVPALKALAPTQSEPPFAVAQGLVLVCFGAATVLAVRRFRPGPGPAATLSPEPVATGGR